VEQFEELMRAAGLLDRRVSPEGGPAASFRRVAEATGSGVLTQPVTITVFAADAD